MEVLDYCIEDIKYRIETFQAVDKENPFIKLIKTIGNDIIDNLKTLFLYLLE